MSSSSNYSHLLLSLAVLSYICVLTSGLPTGPPVTACGDMTPNHGVEAQLTASPFETLPQLTVLQQGQTVTLSLLSRSTDPFRHFAFDSATPEGSLLGTFSNPSDGQLMDCSPPAKSSAAAHQSNADKMQVTVDWTPPSSFRGSAFFKTTYNVMNTTIFWVKTISSSVTVG